MDRELNEVDARQANRRKTNLRVLVISTLAVVVILLVAFALLPG